MTDPAAINERSPVWCRVSSFALLCLLCSCAGQDQKKPNYADMKWSQRVSQQFKDPTSIHSPFQKQVFNATRGVKTTSFKTSEFHGTNSFQSGKGEFKAGGFSQADKTSNVADKTFSGADQQSKLGSESFRTKQSRFGGQANSNAGRISPLANDVFKTGENPAGTKASKNARRPLIQDPVAPAYSEAEVRSFLNKL